jgi:hypothetical protein
MHWKTMWKEAVAAWITVTTSSRHADNVQYRCQRGRCVFQLCCMPWCCLASHFIDCRFFNSSGHVWDRVCGLVVRVPGYRSRGPGFDSRRYHIFWEVVGLEWGSLSLVSITKELFEWKSSGSGSRKPRLTAVGIRCADHATPSISKSWH